MKKTTFLVTLAACGVLTAAVAEAASFKISLGIRETGTTAAIFGNGGTSGTLEQVNKDGQTLVADGTWQLFTFTPNADVLTAFVTGDGVLSSATGTIEHIRLLNDQGVTDPIRIWIDDVTNTVASGPVVQDFEAEALGAKVMFQEPGFSGSTIGELPGSTSAVTDSMAFSGTQSLQLDVQFGDNNPANWARITTFPGADLIGPNAAVVFQEPGAPNPTISFYAKAEVIPEPASLLLMGLACVGLGCLRTRS